MRIDFLTPWGALAALALVAPLAALALGARRSRRAAASLGLEPPSRRVAIALPAACITAAVGLVAVAAAQPVAFTTQAGSVRTDAEALVVIDTSRSMLARAAPGNPTRLERAREAALELRAALADVPTGLASFTDRVLPSLLPSPSLETFRAVLERSVGIDEPPPRDPNVQATTLFALSDVARGGFFDRSAAKKLVVVFTDGESRPFSTADTARILSSAGIRLLAVRIGNASERIFAPAGAIEGEYRPDPQGAEVLQALADAAGGRVFTTGELGAARDAARELLGQGELVPSAREERSTPLAPYAVLLAIVPLIPILWRRNLT